MGFLGDSDPVSSFHFTAISPSGFVIFFAAACFCCFVLFGNRKRRDNTPRLYVFLLRNENLLVDDFCVCFSVSSPFVLCSLNDFVVWLSLCIGLREMCLVGEVRARRWGERDGTC